MALKALRDRILSDGQCLEGGILKVDNFLNHQIDPYLMEQIGAEFVRRFADIKVNKIVTIEASGIVPAFMVGYLMKLPVVFAKKKIPSTIDNFYQARVYSFTKQTECPIVLNKEYLNPDDHVLFIDDFLACGYASKGIIELCRQSGATVEGMGFVIEKEFQHGRQFIRKMGIQRIESLAIIESLDNGDIKIKED